MTATPEPMDIEQQIATLREAARHFETQSEFFETLIRSLPGLFYLIDSDFNIHRWNTNVETVTGYVAEDVPTMDILSIFEGENRDRIQQAVATIFKSGVGSVEAVLTTKDGRKIPHLWTGAGASIGGKNYLLGMGLDISQQKQVENELRESEALYRIFAERMTEGVILFHDFKILFINHAAVATLKYLEPRLLLKKNVLELVVEEFVIYFREMFENVQAGLNAERFFQGRWLTREKKEIWAEGRANHIQWKGLPTVLVSFRDITESKLKEISMQEEAETLRRENVNLRSTMTDRYRLGKIIGKSVAMQKVYELILNAAASVANVVIYGESGTGKELVARAVHNMSSRVDKPFVPVNSSAIPENLLESEFFGHRKGAFTGAHANKPGYLDMAHGGTLFLDEVGDLTPGLQAKLLRAIEGGGYSPVGSNVINHSDFRIISATNKDLPAMCREGKMREDFFYRIHIIPVYLPPLRERKDDISLLVEHFLRQYAPDMSVQSLSGQVMEALNRYDYPGNVRELQNIIQRFLAVKSLDFLPTWSTRAAPEKKTAERPKSDEFDKNAGLHDNIEVLEKNVIREALEQFRGNKSRAAIHLNISRKTLARKMKRFGLM